MGIEPIVDGERDVAGVEHGAAPRDAGDDLAALLQLGCAELDAPAPPEPDGSADDDVRRQTTPLYRDGDRRGRRRGGVRRDLRG
jgi:hypothetical protein